MLLWLHPFIPTGLYEAELESKDGSLFYLRQVRAPASSHTQALLHSQADCMCCTHMCCSRRKRQKAGG